MKNYPLKKTNKKKQMMRPFVGAPAKMLCEQCALL